MGGMLARSPPWRRAAALRLNHRTPAHTAAQGGGHKLSVCAGTAQNMFHTARAFNQPLAAWDVGQVTDMQVCRCPASGSGARAHTQLLRGAATSRVRVLARRSLCSMERALSTSLWKLGTSARSTLCRCAVPLPQGHRAPAHTQLLTGVAASRVRVLAWRRICSSPRALSTSLWTLGTLARSPTCRCAAALPQGHRAPAQTQLLQGAATSRVRVLVRRRPCSPGRALSTSPWKLGTLARLPTCRFAAALRRGHRAPAHAQLLRGAATSRVRVLARRSLCSLERALSTSLWKLGTSARSLTWWCAAALRHGHRAPTHTRRSGGHKPCACAGAAQGMFQTANSFNQPLEAWDVGQVTCMWVRRCPASGSQGSGANTAAQ